MNRSWGIGWVYGVSFFGLALVVISLMGNAVGSLATEGEFNELTFGNYTDVVKDEDFWSVLGRTMVLGVGTVMVLMCFALPFSWLLARSDFRWKGSTLNSDWISLYFAGFSKSSEKTMGEICRKSDKKSGENLRVF